MKVTINLKGLSKDAIRELYNLISSDLNKEMDGADASEEQEENYEAIQEMEIEYDFD